MTADYRRFLAAPAALVEVDLPYFGGPFVEAADRRLRLTGPPPAPGFWRFTVQGRRAGLVGPAEPPDLSALPAVRGYAVAGQQLYLVHERAERLALPPADEPLPFAPLIGRRWPTGELLDGGLDFEAGVEDDVRRRFTERQTLQGLSGVPAALRAAYAYAVLLRVSRLRGLPARPAEARAQVPQIADGGDDAALRVLMDLVRARAEAPRVTRVAPVVVTPVDAGVEERAAAALDAARAQLRETRRLADNLLEVRYDLDGERFVSLVDVATLRVVDAGICLDGHDDRLTLHSLPGVVRQAMRDGVLNITAW